MENLTVAEINQLLVDAGSTVVVETATFEQINASNEASYLVTYNGKQNHAFVKERDGLYRISLNDLVEIVSESDTIVAPVVDEGESTNTNAG